ncbi:MAG TPA: DUF4157 domain-containing protein [Opitutaceae bacterium]|jgi:hypothetical protein|nr:DUF4157 domain-containing protein [Opitutaceae bacterium]
MNHAHVPPLKKRPLPSPSPAEPAPASQHASAKKSPGATPCACGGGCPRCAGVQGLPSADFSQVRLHPEAAEVTAPLQAKAVTRGQDVYFHPGQFQPGTPKGQALIAHELAHTLQTRLSAPGGSRPASFVSQPGDAFENNADALARGTTTRALAAPAGAALRSPFDSENAADQARREQLLQSISNAANTLIRLLQTKGLMKFETASTRSGVQGVVYAPLGANSIFTNYADRDALIRRIIRFLQAMGTLYRTAPIPSRFSAPTLDASTGNYTSSVQYPPGGQLRGVNYQASDPQWADLQAAYERYLLSQGLTSNQPPYDLDWLYLDPSNTVVPGAASGAPRLSGGIQTGVNMVVPDIEHEPLRYWRLTGSSPTPKGSVIIELWHDTLGYYYMNHGQRIDVPSPWAH